MTDAGTFVNNGAERVIVSQLVRSPGVYFGEATTRPAKALHRHHEPEPRRLAGIRDRLERRILCAH